MLGENELIISMTHLRFTRTAADKHLSEVGVVKCSEMWYEIAIASNSQTKVFCRKPAAQNRQFWKIISLEIDPFYCEKFTMILRA